MNPSSSSSPIAVVGSGRMGRGISLSFAFSGYAVQLFDSEERSEEAFGELSASIEQEIKTEMNFLQRLQLVSAQQALDIAARVTVVARSDSAAYLAQAEFLFEAVAEVLEIKRSTYTWLNTVVADTAVIGSTTSTILVDTLAEFVNHNSRFLNTHWLNPALLMPLVEMSPGQH
ncbi:MAG: 3-hydroxybutyryl-CoA dehydrogenase, partial [Halieaceae bacterium]|nr:3-hydroxybutyryl-CoA dehydrogenase [Halieaceae bacterium]